MRLIVPLLLSATLFAQQPKSPIGTSNSWWPRGDKSMHMFAGSLVGAGAYIVADKLGYKRPWLHALFWSTLAGLWKERYDLRHGGRPEYADAAYTTLGGVSVSFLIKFNNNRIQKKYGTAPKLEPVADDPEPTVITKEP